MKTRLTRSQHQRTTKSERLLNLRARRVPVHKGRPHIRKASLRIPSILVPIDFSAPSRKVLEYAASFASRFAGRLTLLHVVEPIAAPDFTGAFPLMVAEDKLLAGCEAGLKNLAKSAGIKPQLLEKVLVRQGRSFHEITDTARRLGSTLIIIGTHGRTGFKRALLGSTAERVVQHAPCPVLVVRPSRKLPVQRWLSMKKILVPVDFSPGSVQAVRWAIPIARKQNSELALLNVMPPLPYYGQGDSALFHYGVSEPDYAKIESEMRANANQQLSALKQEELPPEVTGTTLIRTGSAALGIVQAARTLPAELIVICTHGRTGLSHVLLGSVAEHVVRTAPCPVLVVRQQDTRLTAGR